MKNKKTDSLASLIGKRVIVKKSNFSLRFLIEKIEKIEKIDEIFFEGPIEIASPNCPFPVNSIYSVSENEIKYYTVIS